MSKKQLTIFGITEINGNPIVNVSSLSGGVSSEIYKVDTQYNSFCVKKALRQLKVKKVWKADTIRSYYEYLWLKKVKKILPKSVPKVFKYSRKNNFLILEYLDTKKYSVLKNDLLSGKVDCKAISALSKKLSIVHANLKSENNKKIFQRHNFNFINLRIAPYLFELKKNYSELNNYIKQVSNNLINYQHTVIHGDFTPKNILVNSSNQIILDAEVASYGDPSFDIVSMLNHLLIKIIFVRKNKNKLIKALRLCFNNYFNNVTWEDRQSLISRSNYLLPAMILARVDGKSPVEYLKYKKHKNMLRKLAMDLISTKDYDFETVINRLNYVKR